MGLSRSITVRTSGQPPDTLSLAPWDEADPAHCLKRVRTVALRPV